MAWRLLNGALALVLGVSCSSGAATETAPPQAHRAGQPSDAGATTCQPATCQSMNAECGAAPNGCGGKVTCGECAKGTFCGGAGPNRCGGSPCTPATCESTGAQCGVISDGCGDTKECGTCPAPLSCAIAEANQCGCVPKTCLDVGAECGPAQDGCGHVLDCGKCLEGKHCASNQCGAEACTPSSCKDLGVNCGDVGDGCQSVITCGTCLQPERCGGGGKSNVCGCTPKVTCETLQAECGEISTDCGTTQKCGECSGGKACLNGECGCQTGQYLCNNQCVPAGSCCSSNDCQGLLVCPSAGSKCACRTDPARQPIYRSRFTVSSSATDHLLSVAQDEGPNAGYTSEGIAFYTYPAPCQWGLISLYRMARYTTGEHTYATDPAERGSYLSNGWDDEGDIGCIAMAADCGAVPLYRLVSSMHIFTVDPAEKTKLLTDGFTDEGVQGYVWTEAE